MARKNSVLKTVSDFLRSKKANVEICNSIIEKCSKWIDENKQKEIADIDKQISELQKMKDNIINK